MANTVVKVVTDDIADVAPTNIDMVELEDSSEETSIQFTEINPNLVRSNVPVDVLLQLAAQNGGKNFNIFVKSSESSSIPKKDPRAVQTALKEATEHFKHISNIRFTRTGTVIISTNDLMCAVDISKIASFLGVTVTTRVLWENISNRFLLFNIPVDIPLAEIGQEIAIENNLDILELRRFYRQGSTNDVSPVLVTILGTVLPKDVKVWLTNQQVRQFIDRPRQCRKCFKFNHASAKCQSEQLCVTCSVQHDGPCTNPVKCNNCNEEHRSDYNQCPARLKEIEVLKFKSNNFLSFVEARRQFAKKTEAKSFAKVTSKQVTDFEQFKTLIESRTNAMLKVIIDYIMQYSEKISEAIGTLSTTIMNCLAKLSDRSPDRRKRHNNGTSSNITIMEGRIELPGGPSEFDLNKERLATLKEEYQRLCYEIKKKEFLRSSSHSAIQQQIRLQWKKINELKAQKSDLTMQLRLQDSESFANKANKNLEKFNKLLDEMVKLEEQVKKQNEEIEIYEKKIAEVEKKIRQKRKEIIKANQNLDKMLKHQKDIAFLENRLNLSLTKYNQLLISNNALREDIGSLLQTQAAFRKQYNNIKHLISLGKKTATEIVHSATTSYQTGESVKFKLNLLNERVQVDQKKLEEKIKELQLLIEQDKELKDFIDFKGKDRASLNAVEETEAKKEQMLEQQLKEYQSLMSRIQLASGCKDVNRICKTYIQHEETNISLFDRVNRLNVEIEKLHEEVIAEREELELLSHQYKEQKRKDMAEKCEIDAAVDKLRTEAYEIESAADIKSEQLELAKLTIHRIFNYLDEISSHEVTFTVDDVVTDDNILLYLEGLEKRVLDLVECQKFLDRKQMYYSFEE